MAALTLASLGSAVFALPAAAARASAESVADTIRSGPLSVRPITQSPASGARTAKPAVAPRVASPCDSTFHQVTPNPNPGMAYNAISNNGMAAISSTDVWAVGGYGDTNAGPDQTLAMKWDGSMWTKVTTPNLGPGNDDLWGVTVVPGAAADIANIWTVGDYTDLNGIEHAQALQLLTANTWTQYTPPQIAGSAGNNILFSSTAIAANNVWAVGNWRQSNGNPNTIPPTPASPAQTLIGHWDGTAFTTSKGPQVSTTSSDRLISVSATGPNDVWAVGRSRDNGVNNTLILHYNGTSWSIVTGQNPSATNQTLYSVAAISPMLAYAAGSYQSADGRNHTLLEKWDGASWTVVPASELTGPGSDSYLFSLSALSSTNIWAGGAVYSPNSSLTPSAGLVQHWDGTQWKIVPSVDGNPGNFNELNAILAASPSEIWAGGDYVSPTLPYPLLTLTNRLCMSIPTVTGVLPISGNATGGTTVAISGTDFNFASAVKFGATAATSFTINSNNQITAATPAGTAGTVDVTVTNPAGTSAISPVDTYVYVPPAISWQQYWLAGSDGTTWQPIDATNLSLTFTPTADSKAILSGNADLWTSVPGVNQDIGILVTGGTYGTLGTVVAWKESGGFAGTYSPNAAFVQTVIPVLNGTQYGARLVWKANKPTTGTIYVAAGNAPSFSPTRLTAELVPTTSANLQTMATNAQYWLTGSNGTAWADMDSSGALTIANFTPAAAGSALISVNVDLWTAKLGVNQDVGIFVTGGTYGTAPNGTIVGWKESGGFAGTLSPNAAYAQTVIQVASGVQYTVKVQWKANVQTAGTIYAAAGNAGAFSPTRLTLRFFPAGTGLQDASVTTQVWKAGSTGADWTPIDSTNLKLTVIPTANSLYVLSANADLWTATAGVNQDMAIFISGGAYGSGTLVAWKESGGFAGTFSPNAAFVQTVIPLAMSVTYTITLEWKANKSTNGVIYTGAGNGPYSPTRITAQLLS
jgi:hypothetical protein